MGGRRNEENEEMMCDKTSLHSATCEDEQDESCITGANHAHLCRKHADAPLLSVINAEIADKSKKP